MTKKAVVSARVDPELKTNVEQVFKALGLTTTQAITLFFKQVEYWKGLPFEVKIPNRDTVQALEDARARQNLVTFNSLDDLLSDLEI
ncbi:MAG TPA: type II toxin-antitoxin system RelB/DinJ family antitoxin [Anaerolineae bacterium]|nr:type II toxin-antitoxin system RelB/DinJ family antitoxin [Anaerolineae bacterium]HQK15193.1 type II toxin-antitoxin system RelB/DinJ family antitoxin [Anaerolineae bacterium]